MLGLLRQRGMLCVMGKQFHETLTQPYLMSLGHHMVQAMGALRLMFQIYVDGYPPDRMTWEARAPIGSPPL
jgi:hypothetical protein